MHLNLMKNLSIISHNVAETVGKELEKHWLNELKLHPQNPSFLRACLKTYGPRYLWSAFLMLGKKTRSNIAKVILTPLLSQFSLGSWQRYPNLLLHAKHYQLRWKCRWAGHLWLGILDWVKINGSSISSPQLTFFHEASFWWH